MVVFSRTTFTPSSFKERVRFPNASSMAVPVAPHRSHVRPFSSTRRCQRIWSTFISSPPIGPFPDMAQPVSSTKETRSPRYSFHPASPSPDRSKRSVGSKSSLSAPSQQGVEQVPDDQNPNADHARERGNQAHLEDLPEDDHLRQRQADDRHHESQDRPQGRPLAKERLYDRDDPGGVRVHGYTDPHGERNRPPRPGAHDPGHEVLRHVPVDR